MCLILFTVDQPAGYRMILAANRDEFYDRPSAALHFWPDAPEILAGRDLKSGGTWLGITRGGRFAAITNYRDPAAIRPDAPSRGALVAGFLLGAESAAAYLRRITPSAGIYNGFNLIIADVSGVYWLCSRKNGYEKLRPGIYGLSNHLLDTPWPKVRKGKEKFRRLADSMATSDSGAFLDLLADQGFPPEAELPSTGVGPVWEKRLSPLFITSAAYGTRCSSVLIWEKDGYVSLTERGYRPRSGLDGAPPLRGHTRQYRLNSR